MHSSNNCINVKYYNLPATLALYTAKQGGVVMSVDFLSALAFYPAYATHGLSCQVVYASNTVASDLCMGTLVKHACRQFALDKKALANAAQFVSGRRNLVPLTLCVDRTFVPLKALTPRVAGDSAYGYFLLQAIAKVEAERNGSRLFLSNGVALPLVQSRPVAMNHLARAALFEKVFWSKRLGSAFSTGVWQG